MSSPPLALRWLAAHRPVRPSAEAVGVCQNRLVEKRFLVEHGFPLAPFAAIARATDLEAAGDELFPGILKVIRHGYDGKGQVRVATRAEALTAFAELGGEACVLEALLPLEGEVSVVLARGADGEVQAYTPSENEHRHGILDVSIVPARLPAERLAEAQAVASDRAETAPAASRPPMAAAAPSAPARKVTGGGVVTGPREVPVDTDPESAPF